MFTEDSKTKVGTVAGSRICVSGQDRFLSLGMARGKAVLIHGCNRVFH